MSETIDDIIKIFFVRELTHPRNFSIIQRIIRPNNVFVDGNELVDVVDALDVLTDEGVNENDGSTSDRSSSVVSPGETGELFD
jgi:hypothetical protein